MIPYSVHLRFRNLLVKTQLILSGKLTNLAGNSRMSVSCDFFFLLRIPLPQCVNFLAILNQVLPFEKAVSLARTFAPVQTSRNVRATVLFIRNSRHVSNALFRSLIFSCCRIPFSSIYSQPTDGYLYTLPPPLQSVEGSKFNVCPSCFSFQPFASRHSVLGIRRRISLNLRDETWLREIFLIILAVIFRR